MRIGRFVFGSACLFFVLCASAIAQREVKAPLLPPTGPANPHPLMVGYLPFYKGVSWVDYAPKIDFSKMTHLNLAFVNPVKCDGVCTAKSNMEFVIKGQTDEGVDAVVAAAHAHGVKVLASIGGGGGDQMIIQYYNAGLTDPLVASLDTYMKKHKLDGVDVDMEDPSNMGMPLTVFTKALVATFRPQGKLVTAAVAQYLQSSMRNDTLNQFDFINVMVYSGYQKSIDALDFYANQKHFPKDKITLGVGFFATSVDGKEKEEDYAKIMAAYPNAWKVDLVGGGPLDDGRAFGYAGEATMAKEVQLGKQYGGIMIWELMGDAPPPHSLWDVIQKNF